MYPSIYVTFLDFVKCDFLERLLESVLQLSHDQQLLDKIALEYLMNQQQIRKQQGNRIIETNKKNLLSTYCNLKYECTSHRRWMDSRIRTHGGKIIEESLRGVWEKGDFFFLVFLSSLRGKTIVKIIIVSLSVIVFVLQWKM